MTFDLTLPFNINGWSNDNGNCNCNAVCSLGGNGNGNGNAVCSLKGNGNGNWYKKIMG